MSGRLPLPSLLSQALVAFIIEFDNEFEHRTPHRTTTQSSTAGLRHVPWLVSMPMWSSFLQYVDEEGITVAELHRRIGSPKKEMELWLTRLSKWWGYLVVKSADPVSKSSRSSARVRPTSGGLKAIQVWRPLTGEIESRWTARFGKAEIDDLRCSLQSIVAAFATGLPDCLPILGYGLTTAGRQRVPASESAAVSDLPLPSLLSKALLAFAIEFESQSAVSLAICANVLRLVEEDSTLLRDLPRLAGVSRESIDMAVSFMKARGYAILKSGGKGQAKRLELTTKGRQAQKSYEELLGSIEDRWASVLGATVLSQLRASLERLTGPGPEPSLLLQGLDPYPDCWRAELPKPEHLPHFPMILHRGGFPDGS